MPMRLFLLPDDFFELGFVLGFATGARHGIYNARGFWLAYALSGVGLYGLGGREWGWLAFRHGKHEYGRVWYETKAP